LLVLRCFLMRRSRTSVGRCASTNPLSGDRFPVRCSTTSRRCSEAPLRSSRTASCSWRAPAYSTADRGVANISEAAPCVTASALPWRSCPPRATATAQVAITRRGSLGVTTSTAKIGSSSTAWRGGASLKAIEPATLKRSPRVDVVVLPSTSVTFMSTIG